MRLTITPTCENEVIESLRIGDTEGAIEVVLKYHPYATRDDAVDAVDDIETNAIYRGEL